MADRTRDHIDELVDLSLERGRRRGEYRPPAGERPARPALRAVPDPPATAEQQPGLLARVLAGVTATLHRARKGQ
ncbi:hypothetical protein [Nocardia farcinica]